MSRNPLVWHDQGPNRFSWFAPPEPDNRPRIKIREYLELVIEDGKLLITDGYGSEVEIDAGCYRSFLDGVISLAVELGWEKKA